MVKSKVERKHENPYATCDYSALLKNLEELAVTARDSPSHHMKTMANEEILRIYRLINARINKCKSLADDHGLQKDIKAGIIYSDKEIKVADKLISKYNK